MEKKKSEISVCDIEGVQEIKDFLTQWYAIEDLYFKAAEAGSVIINLAANGHLTGDELDIMNVFLEEHMMMIGKLAKFECDNE